jgi:hypothetical protein
MDLHQNFLECFFSFSFIKVEGKSSLGKPRRRWENIIASESNKSLQDVNGWTVSGSVTAWVLVNKVLNLRVAYKPVHILTR